MKRLLVLVFCLFFMGCGNAGLEASSLQTVGLEPVGGRRLLAADAGNDVVAAIDALPPAESDFIYAKVYGWSDSNVPLTGTVEAAVQALASIVRQPKFGAHKLYLILSRLSPDSGQGFVSTFGQTLSAGDDTAVARAQDSLDALLSRSAIVSQNVEPIILQNLPAEISSIQEFHGLRILDPAFLPAAKRQAMINIRNLVPNANGGETIRKIIKVSDMQNYLNGTFDPEVGGSVAQLDQTDFLLTPAQFIAGLRLDYPGGFQGQTQVAALTFPQTADFQLSIPFSPVMGGAVTGQVYPFTGNGFTANVQAQAIPEFRMPAGVRTPLAEGAQLHLIDENGESRLQGTLNAQGQWTLNGTVLSRREARHTVRRHATYRGLPIWVSSTDGNDYRVSCEGYQPPDDFFRDMHQVGPLEYLGRVPVGDSELVI